MKTALVIGATGGIGHAMSAELEHRGYVVSGLSRKDGFDVCEPERAQTKLDTIDGPFDIVFVALGTLAAGGTPEKSLSHLSVEKMADVFTVNTYGPALILRNLDRLLPRKGRAVAAFLSARVGSIGDNHLGGWYSYRASKAALNQLVHTAAIELARKRKDAVITSLHPGTVETAFTADYPAHRKISAQASAEKLCTVMEALTPDQTGGFYDNMGRVIEW